MSRIASVLLPMPLPEAFDYEVPEGWPQRGTYEHGFSSKEYARLYGA